MTHTGPGAPAVSRRALLRSGALVAGGAAVVPGVASAHECPRTPGYWANHPWPDTVPDPFEIGGVTTSVSDWQAFLLAPPRGDKAHVLAKHLVATVVNFQFRPALSRGGDPGCVDEPLAEFGGRTVREVRLAAERWLDASSFDAPAPQRSWVAGGADGEPLKDALDAFNNDALGLDCDCDGDRRDGAGGRGGANPASDARPGTAGRGRGPP